MTRNSSRVRANWPVKIGIRGHNSDVADSSHSDPNVAGGPGDVPSEQPYGIETPNGCGSPDNVTGTASASDRGEAHVGRTNLPIFSLPPLVATKAMADFVLRTEELSSAMSRALIPADAMRAQVAAIVTPLLREQQRISLIARVSQIHFDMRNQMAKSFAPMIELVRGLRWNSDLAKTVERLGQHFAEALPPNWPVETSWTTVVALIEETGWALVWVPDAEVVARILAIDESEARQAALVADSGKIIVSIRERMEEVEDEGLTYAAACVLEAANALDSGMERASQALSASVLTGLIQSVMGFEKLATARECLQKQRWQEGSLPYLRYAVITSTIPLALARFFPGDTIPDSFNRHASVHHPSPAQFTKLNALVALTLVAALTRELNELARRGFLSNSA